MNLSESRKKDKFGLGFWIETRGAIWVRVGVLGGVQPAHSSEVTMWRKLCKLNKEQQRLKHKLAQPMRLAE